MDRRLAFMSGLVCGVMFWVSFASFTLLKSHGYISYKRLITPESKHYSPLESVSLWYRIDWESERNASINGTPTDYLKDYRNPCWVVRVNDIDSLYDDNAYGRTNEKYPNIDESFSVSDSFSNVKALLRERQSQAPGSDTWRLRCLPLVYLAGVTKSGTSDLFAKILEHPDIIPGAVKEPMWWNRRTIRAISTQKRPVPFSDYVDLFDEAAEEIRNRSVTRGEDDLFHPSVTIDATPCYLWDYDGWSNIPGNTDLEAPEFTMALSLRALVPHAKIIVILRNPGDRLYSQYRMFSGQKSPAEFHIAVSRAMDKMTKCFSDRSPRGCAYTRYQPMESQGLFLRASMYAVFLRDWLSVFPRDQLLIIRAEDYYEDRRRVLAQVFTFLDLDPLSDGKLTEVVNQRAVNTRADFTGRDQSPMLNTTRELLQEFYQPFNEDLAQFLDDEKFLWRDSS